MVRSSVKMFVILQRSAKETEVHEELGTTAGDPFCGLIGGLFASISLFLEVEVLEGVIVKFGRHAVNGVREDVELVFPRRTKSQRPKFRFDLAGLCGRVERGGGATDKSSVADVTNRVAVDHVDVSGAVI